MLRQLATTAGFLALLVGCSSSGPAGTPTGAGGQTGTAGSGGSTGTTTGGQSTSGGTSGPGGPQVVFEPNPVPFSLAQGFDQNVIETSLSGQSIPQTPNFVFIPDGGDCVGFVGGPENGGQNLIIDCGGGENNYLLSFAADRAGTTVYVQSMLDDGGNVTCAGLYYTCPDGDSDCCKGLSCTPHDAGPQRGEVEVCDYNWAPEP